MQDFDNKSIDIYQIRSEEEIKTLPISLHDGDKIAFVWDLGSGKSTMIRSILRQYFHDPDLIVRSPTYTYYQKYGKNIYHFDLYRLESVEDFYLIWGQDILENPGSICLIEWPEILGEGFNWNKKISLEIQEDQVRKVTITSQTLRATE